MHTYPLNRNNYKFFNNNNLKQTSMCRGTHSIEEIIFLCENSIDDTAAHLTDGISGGISSPNIALKNILFRIK